MDSEGASERHGSAPVDAVLVATTSTNLPVGQPTVLRRVGGVTLLHRALASLQRAGVRRVVVVAGQRSERLQAALRTEPLDVELVVDPDRQHGTAAAVAVGLARVDSDRCLVIMGDHVFESSDVRRLLDAPGRNVLAVDRDPGRQVGGMAGRLPLRADLAPDGSVRALGTRPAADGDAADNIRVVDAGLTVAYREDLLAVAPTTPDASWAHWRRRLVDEGAGLTSSEVTGLWASLDSADDVRGLERAMWRRYGPKPTDGIVARLVNRRISGPLTRQLLRTGMHPDVATVLAFTVTLLAAGLLGYGNRWSMLAGGLGVVLGSALDGVDGEIARVSGRASRRGATLDTLLDRYADLAVVLGLVVGAGATPTTWAWGFAAACGCLLVSYVHAVGRDTDVRLLFRREFRLLIFAVAAVAGVPLWGLVVVAVAANTDVVRGVVLLLRALHR
jgi:CDP-L-myo-inositol myo-inositolphosphotransferase